MQDEGIQTKSDFSSINKNIEVPHGMYREIQQEGTFGVTIQLENAMLTIPKRSAVFL